MLINQIFVPADISTTHNKTEKRKEDVCHIILQLHFDRKNANKIPQGKE